MHILAVETTGRYASAALIREDGRCVCESSPEAMNHLRDITELIDRCLVKCGCRVTDLTHLAASIGPGSFTGIRIGVTTARTLAQALELPCIAVPTLEGMATQAIAAAEGRRICTIINARRGQVYGAVWRTENGVPQAEVPEGQYMIEELLAKAKKGEMPVYLVGDGIDAYGEAIAAAVGFVAAEETERYQEAASVAAVALRLAKCGRQIGYEDLLPDYMRKSEAEMRLEEGTLSKKIGVQR